MARIAGFDDGRRRENTPDRLCYDRHHTHMTEAQC
jgi:hypothetical protein